MGFTNSARASASLIVSSATLASDGKTLTANIGGVSGSLSPSSGITGFTVKSIDPNSKYNVYPVTATATGSTVTLVLNFPIASGRVVTVDLATSSGSNLTDGASNTPTGQTGVSVTNNSSRTVTFFPASNSAIQCSESCSTSAPNGVFANRTLFWTNGFYNGRIDFSATGTDVAFAMVDYTSKTDLGSTVVDGNTTTWTAALSPLPANYTNFFIQPILSSSTDTLHNITVYDKYKASNSIGIDGSTGILVAGASPSLSIPSGSWGTQYYLSTDPSYVSLYTIPRSGVYYSFQGGQSFRFTSNTSFVAIWDYSAITYAVYQDGVQIATTATISTATNLTRTVLASGLDTTHSHQYWVMPIFGSTNVSYFEIDTGSLSAVAKVSPNIETFYGDSISADWIITDDRQGDSYIVTNNIGSVARRVAVGGTTMSIYGRDHASNIPATSSRVWVRYGTNDLGVTTIGSVGQAGTFTGDYYTMIGNIRTQIGAGKPIYLEGIFPRSNVNRVNYNTAMQTAVAAYKASNPTDTAIQYISTDNWINTTDDQAEPHPTAQGYAKIANREIPYASTTGYTIAGSTTGSQGQASTNFTVTIASGSTFTGDETVTLSDGSNGGTFTPSVGSPGVSTVTVTPANGATSFTFTYIPATAGTKTLTFTNGQGWTDSSSMTYVVSSTDATLSNLEISQGSLSPTFSSGTTSYTASVANGVTNLTVTPTANQANATITVNGTPVTSGNAPGSITLNIGSNTLTTVVTAQDGSTTNTYTITATRAASGGSMSYSISVYVTPNGSISPGSQSIAQGGNYTFSITPNTGYQISDVLIDNVSIGAKSTYTFTNVTQPHTILANFTLTPIDVVEIPQTDNPNIDPSQQKTQLIAQLKQQIISLLTEVIRLLTLQIGQLQK